MQAGSMYRQVLHLSEINKLCSTLLPEFNKILLPRETLKKWTESLILRNVKNKQSRRANIKTSLSFKEQTRVPMNLGFLNFHIHKNVPEIFLNTNYTCVPFRDSASAGCVACGKEHGCRSQTNLPLGYLWNSLRVSFLICRMGILPITWSRED